MVIRLAVSRAVIGLCAAGAASLAAGEALAQANVLKECGSQYQAAKAANELAGQGWQDFLKACRVRLKEAESPATQTKPADAEASKATPAAEAKPAPAAEAPAAPKVEPAKPAAEAPVANPLKAAPPAEAQKAAPAAPAAQLQKDRQKKCAADWKANKKALLKDDPKLTWPKFWSSCNKKLKDAGE
jgi:hypothetical protein